MNEPSKSITSILGEPYNIDNLNENSEKNEIEKSSFELYKEAVGIIMLSANIFENTSPNHPGLTRNQAINMGLLIRIAKLMETVLQLSASGNRGDVIPIIIRCILESSINLQFLIQENDNKYYDQYVEYSLGPDRELYDRIQENVTKRNGKELPIETRMLKSINRAARLSGKKITDIPPKNPDWGGNLKEKLKALGKEQHYVYVQRIPSHIVHGSWVDLLFHHIEEQDSLFIPKPEWTKNDARHLTSHSWQILEVVKLYLNTYFGSNHALTDCIERIDNLIDRTKKIEQLHESSLSKN